MNMMELFGNHYEELTQAQRDIITDTDYVTAYKLQFDSIEDLKEWANDLIALQEEDDIRAAQEDEKLHIKAYKLQEINSRLMCDILKILVDTQYIQGSHESRYTKDIAKLSAYDNIVKLCIDSFGEVFDYEN